MDRRDASGGLVFEGFRLDRQGLFRLDRAGDAKPVALGSRALDLLREQPRSGTSMDIAAAACGYLDRIAEGREWVARLRQLRPGWNIAAFMRFRGRIASPEVRAVFVEGLRKAGLPEA